MSTSGRAGQRKLVTRQLRAAILKFVSSQLKEKEEKPTFVGCLICANRCEKTFTYRISPNPHSHAIMPTFKTGKSKLN